jgi:hypothetical protein
LPYIRGDHNKENRLAGASYISWINRGYRISR